MDQDEFWRLIELIEGEDVNPLVEALTALTGDQIHGFYEQLGSAVLAVTSDAHRRQVVYDGYDEPLDAEAEEFVAVGLTVVAGGRERWWAIAQEPSLLATTWDTEVAEDLEFAAENAFEEATGDPWPQSPLIQTGVPIDSPPYPRGSWVSLFSAEVIWRSSEAHVLPRSYHEHLSWIETHLEADPAWNEWWVEFRGPDCQLDVTFEYTRTATARTTIRAGHDWAGREELAVKAVVPALYGKRDRKLVKSKPDDIAWARAARDHVDFVLARVAKNFDRTLPTLPDLETMEADRLAAARREAQELAASWAAREQTARDVARMWKGRIGDREIADLEANYIDGGRYRVLDVIAQLRRSYGFEVRVDDYSQLAAAGYSAEQVSAALEG